jgi:hypothetical protein
MTSLRTRELATHEAVCACCKQSATLRITETRLHRIVPIGRFDPQVSRTATCSACCETYPIRSTDVRPNAAAARDGRARPGRHRQGAIHQIGDGRDWSYSESA